MATTVTSKLAGGATASYGETISSTQAVDATTVDGLLLATSQTATAGNQKFSPALHFTGSGWKTAATAGAQACEWKIEVVPSQGTSAPTNSLDISGQVNGGGWNTIMRLNHQSSGGYGVFGGFAWGYAGVGIVSVTSGGTYCFSSTSAPTGTADTALSRVSAGVVGVGTGAAGSFAGTLKATTLLTESANGASWTQGQVSELVTIAAAGTTDTTIDLPADSVIEAVVVRVTTVIPTATTFSVGDPTTAARFKSGISTAANTTAVCIDHWSGAVATLAAGPSQASAAKVRLTMAGGTPAANTGRVRVTIFYRQFVAPTS